MTDLFPHTHTEPPPLEKARRELETAEAELATVIEKYGEARSRNCLAHQKVCLLRALVAELEQEAMR